MKERERWRYGWGKHVHWGGREKRYTGDREPGQCGVMGSGERVGLRAESGTGETTRFTDEASLVCVNSVNSDWVHCTEGRRQTWTEVAWEVRSEDKRRC